MSYFLALLGIAASFFLIKYRESIGSSFPEPEWMHYVGGIYNFVVIVGILIFFLSVSVLTGTTDLFFAPLMWILPVGNAPAPIAPTPTF